MMQKQKLFWGDFHKHIPVIERADEVIESAKYNLDVYVVLCYPFTAERVNGALIETVRQREEFLDAWEKLQQASSRHNEEGRFVTFPGYEWHGNRTEYGDHNVVYFKEGNPLDDAWDIKELFANLENRKAIAIPHHTAYLPGRRGKRWEYHSEEISPVMEIYSSHGSSEGVNMGAGLLKNCSMGPDVSGGSFIDALKKGVRVGVIGSNDGPGPGRTALPGSWPCGVAGIWAEELTRESVWEALKKRRTFAATGDRIKLWFEVDRNPQGSVIAEEGGNEAMVKVEASQPLDRIELVHNGRVKETYVHPGDWEFGESEVSKILVEFGWGPAKVYGFKNTKLKWEGSVEIKNGKILSVEPRFSGIGQSFKTKGENICSYSLETDRGEGAEGAPQGLIFEIRPGDGAALIIKEGDKTFSIGISETFGSINLFPFLGESKNKVSTSFNLKESEIENPDIYFNNARKIRVHPAYPEKSYSAEAHFRNLPKDKGENNYYVRVHQRDGQKAWSSPVWFLR